MAQPIFFGASGSALFAWYYPAAASVTRPAAVVLCPPLMLDFMSAYRSWRILAERLAAAGFAVIGLEYRGTGNSWGGPRDAGQVAAWQESIAQAAEEVRRRSGADQVALVGLRLGATLAATVARRIGAGESLVLWSPLASGRAYLREIRALVALGNGEGYAEVDGEISAAGFVLTKQLAEELGALDLVKLEEAPAARVLLIEAEERASIRKVAERFRALGSAVTFAELPGTAEMLLGANYAKLPEPIIDRIIEWLAGQYPAAESRRRLGEAPAERSSSQTACIQERTVRFGPEEGMFGILSESADSRPRTSAVIFLNTGCNHHSGPHRMFVPLAREVAALGIPAFRFDFRGIGASRPALGSPENVPYPPHAMEDIRLAVEQVRRDTGAKRVTLVGLCSGGWHALRAAREGVAIDGVLAINPPFYFKGGDPDEAKEAIEAEELARYKRSLGEPEKWKKLIRGEVRAGALLRLALARAGRELRTRIPPLSSNEAVSTTTAELLSLAQGSLPILLVFDPQDRSHVHFDLHLSKAIRKAPGSLRWTMVEAAGDTFRPMAAQERLREILLDSLKQWAV